MAAASAALLVVAVPPATAGSPQATASDHFLTFLTDGKLKVRKRLAFQVVCNADCNLSATTKLKLKGPDLGPVTSTATFPAGVVAEAFLKPNQAARNAIKAKIGAARLITEVTATNVLTGEVEILRRTFKFKR